MPDFLKPSPQAGLFAIDSMSACLIGVLANSRFAEGLLLGSAFSITGNPPTLNIGGGAGTTAQFLRGDGIWSSTLTQANAGGYTALQMTQGDATGASNVNWNMNHGAGTNANFNLTNSGATLRVNGLFNIGTNANTSLSFETNSAGRWQIDSIGHLNALSALWIAWPPSGVGFPAFTTRSVGTKLVLYPELTASSVDYSIGIQSNTMWFAVPQFNRSFLWYGGTTIMGRLEIGAVASNTFFQVGVDNAQGGARLNSGFGSNPGYISFHNNAGTRTGYIGWITGTGGVNNNVWQCENSFGIELQPADNRIKFGGSSSIYGATTIQGEKNAWCGLSFRDSAGALAGTFMLRSSDGYNGIHNRTDSGWLSQLDGAGNFTATGNVTAYSDEKLKEDWEDFRLSLEQILSLPNSTYKRKDTGERQIGTSAQKLQEIIPLAVMEDLEGTLSVDYGRAALAAVLSLAQEVKSLREQLRGA